MFRSGKYGAVDLSIWSKFQHEISIPEIKTLDRQTDKHNIYIGRTDNKVILYGFLYSKKYGTLKIDSSL